MTCFNCPFLISLSPLYRPVTQLLHKTRALIASDAPAKVWQEVAASARRCLGPGWRSSGNDGEKTGDNGGQEEAAATKKEQEEQEEEVAVPRKTTIELDDDGNEGAPRPSVIADLWDDDDGTRLLKFLLQHEAETVVKAAEEREGKRSAILQPLLEELLVLEAVKAACQQRNVVRGEWAKAVKAHEAKKAVLQRAYDKDASKVPPLRLELEEAADSAQAAREAVTQRLSDATRRVMRDHDTVVRADRKQRLLDFTLVWTKVSRSVGQ